MIDMCYKYADYIIKKVNEHNEKCPENEKILLNNKRLQKVLFIASVQYAREHNGKKLFTDNFEAWSYGPVIPEVYRDYSIFQSGYMIPLYPEEKIDEEKQIALDFAFKQTINISTKKLIENAHVKGSPWYFFNQISVRKDNFKKVEKYSIIPHKLIYLYYKDNNNFNKLLEP